MSWLWWWFPSPSTRTFRVTMDGSVCQNDMSNPTCLKRRGWSALDKNLGLWRDCSHSPAKENCPVAKTMSTVMYLTHRSSPSLLKRPSFMAIWSLEASPSQSQWPFLSTFCVFCCAVSFMFWHKMGVCRSTATGFFHTCGFSRMLLNCYCWPNPH
jgi:hypothetical protein